MYRKKPCLDVPFQNQNSYLTSELQWAEQSKMSTGNLSSQYQPMGPRSSADTKELDSCYLPESFFSNFLNTPKNDYDLSLSFQQSVALANADQSMSGLKLQCAENQARNSEMPSMKSKQGDMNFSVQHQPNRAGIVVSAIDEKQSFLNFLDNLKVTEHRLNSTESSPGYDGNYAFGSPWSTGSMADSMSGGFLGHSYHQKVPESFWDVKRSEASFMNATLGSPSVGALGSPAYDRSFQTSANSGRLQSPSNFGAQTNFGADRFDLPSATSSYFYEKIEPAASLSPSIRHQVVNEPPKHQQQEVRQSSSNSVFGDPFLTRPTSLVWSPRVDEGVGTAAGYSLQNMVPQSCISNMPSGYPKTAIGHVNSNARQMAAAPAKRLKPFAVNRKSESMKAVARKEGDNCLNEVQKTKANYGSGFPLSEDVKHGMKVPVQEQLSAHTRHGFSMFSDNMATSLPFSGASNSGASVCTTSSTSSFSTPRIPRMMDSSSFDLRKQPELNSTNTYKQNLIYRPSCDVSCPNFFMKVENCTRCKSEKPPDDTKNLSDPAPERLTLLSAGSSSSVKSESEHVSSPVSIADLIATPGVSIVENHTPITRSQTRRISHSKSFFTNVENKVADSKNCFGPMFPKTFTTDWKIEEENKPPTNQIEEAKPTEAEQSLREQNDASITTGSNASWIFAVPEKNSLQTTDVIGLPINAMSVTDVESDTMLAKETAEKSVDIANPDVENDQSKECPSTSEKLRKRYERDELMKIGLSDITKLEPIVADENKDWFSLVFVGSNSESEKIKKNTAYEICSRPFNSAVFNAKKVCLHPAFQKALLQSVSDK